MKRLFVTFLLMLTSVQAFAQSPETRTSAAGDLVTIKLVPLKVATASPWVDVSAYGSTVHTLTFTYDTQPTGVTVSLQCSTDAGATVGSTIGTSTSTTGATIQGSDICNAIRVNVSGLTGSINIRPVYRGSFVAASSPPGTLRQGYTASAMTGTTSTQVIAAVAGQFLYITSCTVTNGHASVGTDMILQDGSGGTTLIPLPAPTSGSATGVSGGAFAWPWPTPLKVPTRGGALFVANVTTGSSTKIGCSGFSSVVSY